MKNRPCQFNASRMTRAYYFATFGKTSVTDAQKKLLIIERPSTSREFFTDEESYQRQQLAFIGFEEKNKDEGKRKEYYDSLVVLTGKYSFRMDSTWGFTPGYDISFKDLTDKDHAWIRASVSVFPTGHIRSNDALLVVTFNHKGRYYKYRGVRISEPEFGTEPGKWNRITMDYITPEVRSKRDKISIYVWYQGKPAFYVDDLEVELGESTDLRLCEVGIRELHIGRAVPHRLGGDEERLGFLERVIVDACSRVGCEAAHDRHVELVLRQREPIPGWLGHQVLAACAGLERCSQFGYDDVEPVVPATRWAAVPDGIGEHVGRHDLAEMGQQHGQSGPDLGLREWNLT